MGIDNRKGNEKYAHIQPLQALLNDEAHSMICMSSTSAKELQRGLLLRHQAPCPEIWGPTSDAVPCNKGLL